MSLPQSTIAKVLGMLNSTEPKYTQSQISKACGVSLSSVARIKSKALSSNEQVLDLVVLPRGVRDLRQAIRMADVCEYIGFNKPEAAIYCRKENVDINELKAFKARYGGLELCLQKESQLKQKAADKQKLDAKLDEALQQIKKRQYALNGNSQPRVARFGIVFCGAPGARGVARVAMADLIER